MPLQPSNSTYILLPDYSVRPPPKGQVTLGTVFYSLKYGYTDAIICTISPPRSSIIATEKVGTGTQGLRPPGKSHLAFGSIKKYSFEPDIKYLKDVMKNSAIKEYLNKGGDKKPVAYLVTGLKVAQGVKFSGSKGQDSALPGVPPEFVFALRFSKIKVERRVAAMKYAEPGVTIGLSPETVRVDANGRVIETTSDGIYGHQYQGGPICSAERMSADVEVWTGHDIGGGNKNPFACLLCMSDPGGESAEVRRQRRELRKALEMYALDD